MTVKESKIVKMASSVLLMIILAACGSDNEPAQVEPTVTKQEVSVIEPTPEPSATPTVQPEPTSSLPTETATPEPTKIPPRTPQPTDTSKPTSTATPDTREIFDAADFDFPWTQPDPERSAAQRQNLVDLPKIGTPISRGQFYLSPENIDQLTELAVWGKGVISDAIYTAGGDQIVVVTNLGLYLYDAQTAEQILFRPASHQVVAMAHLPQSQLVALSIRSDQPRIELIDAQSLEPQTTLPLQSTEAPRKLHVSTDGEWLVSLSDWVEGWDTATFETVFAQEQMELTGEDSELRGVSFAADTKEIFFLVDQMIQRWAVDNGLLELREMVPFIPEYKDFDSDGLRKLFDQSENMTVSPDGRYLAASYWWSDWILIVDTQNGDVIFQFDVRNTESAQSFLPTKSKGVGLSKVRELSPGLTGPGVHVTNELRFSADSQSIFVASRSLEIEKWDLTNGSREIFLENAGHLVRLSPDQQRMAAVNHHLTQWGIDQGVFLSVLKQHTGRITDVRFVPGSNHVAIASGDGFVYLRDRRNGALESSLRGFNGNNGWFFTPTVAGIAISADGKRLVAAGGDLATVWNLADYSTLSASDLGPFPPIDVAVSADGKFFATSGYNRGLQMWEVEPEGSEWVTYSNDLVSRFDGRICSTEFSEAHMAFSPTMPQHFACSYHNWDGEPILEIRAPIEQADLSFNINAPSFELADHFVSALTYSDDGSRLYGIMQNVVVPVRKGADEIEDRNIDYVSVWNISPNGDYQLSVQAPLPSAGNRRFPDRRLDADPQNQFVAISHSRWGLLFLDIDTGEVIHHFPHILNPTAVAISDDGLYLAVGTAAGTVHLWGVP